MKINFEVGDIVQISEAILNYDLQELPAVITEIDHVDHIGIVLRLDFNIPGYRYYGIIPANVELIKKGSNDSIERALEDLDIYIAAREAREK